MLASKIVYFARNSAGRIYPSLCEVRLLKFLTTPFYNVDEPNTNRALSSTLSLGSRADNQRNVCPGEEIALECPPRGSAITSGDYDELSWDVAEPSDRSGITSTDIGYCGEWDCTRYNNIGAFKKRITVRDPSQGTLSVTQLIKNDLLTYTCKVQLKQDKDPLVYRVNVSSSVNCK